ncbi:MAG: FAD-dependent oxidoreductase [Deltaproteobacteria bacterium]|nr:FAD-dependent oxidoreductase [Deltaproteobacteria bacterium]
MKYLIAGAGPAGVIAAETLRLQDPEGEITLISAEDTPPYSRMAIPYVLTGKIGEEGTHLRREESHYRNIGVEVIRNRRASGLDTSAGRLSLDDGQELPYDRLLIATGSRPVRPPIAGMDLPGVLSCWTLEDAREISSRITEGLHVVLIGAGFIGTIVLDAIAMRKARITVIEAEQRMLPRMINEAGGQIIRNWCEGKGVNVLTGTRVKAITQGGESPLTLELNTEQQIPADLVIVATGVVPNTEFLQGSGIEIKEGIVVDSHLETSVKGVFAAGDVAQGPDFSFGANSVHAIQPTASEHGRIAAMNMAGKNVEYRGSLSMNTVEIMGLLFYSFGKWMGVSDGEHSEAADPARHRYTRLEFEGDYLVGAMQIGPFEKIGILRGLIQSQIPLGDWKARLLEEPARLMEAYFMLTGNGQTPPRLNLNR